MRFLLDRGHELTRVNPGLAGQAIRLRLVVDSLAEAGRLDMVDVVRNASYTEQLVDTVIELGVRAIWMQVGGVDGPAAKKARDAGITVVNGPLPCD